MKALVIDDEPVFRDIYKSQLKLQGFEVFEACNGAEALILVGQHVFDIIFCDIGMPVLDGVSFLKTVRPKFANLPIIIISGGSHYKPSEILACGATAYFDKNDVKIKDIVNTISEWSVNRVK